MATISASMVKELRDKTGAGMMDCKQALQENDGNLEAAVDWLRTKGLAKAAKKAGRVAAEGLVACAVDEGGKKGAVVEINSETDFVARNEQFQELAGTLAGLALDVDGDLERLKAAQVSGVNVSVEDHLTNLVATIGENMSLRRTAALAVDEGVVVSYVHNQVAPGMGKIGVLVALSSSADKQKLDALGKQIAMHVAAAAPVALDQSGISQDLIERERAVFLEQARESGKPDNIIEKMVEGKLRKFYQDVALLSQTFVIDNETKIDKLLENTGKELGSPVSIAGFLRYEIGEGIEKKEEDFAAEVAAAAGQ